MLVLRGDPSYSRFWLKSRGWIPFVPLLLMVAGNEDGSPLRSGQVYSLTAATLVIGGYVLAVHAYVRRRILPVEYRFFRDRVEAWRADEMVASVLTRDVAALGEVGTRTTRRSRPSTRRTLHGQSSPSVTGRT